MMFLLIFRFVWGGAVLVEQGVQFGTAEAVSPVGVRLGFTRPALIQRRIVGVLIPRCRHAATVLIHGSDSGDVVVVLASIFIVDQPRLLAAKQQWLRVHLGRWGAPCARTERKTAPIQLTRSEKLGIRTYTKRFGMNRYRTRAAFHQPAQVGVAALGDGTLFLFAARLVFAGREAEIAHELFGMGEANEVADFGDDHHGRDGLEAAQRHDGVHEGLARPVGALEFHVILDPRDAF